MKHKNVILIICLILLTYGAFGTPSKVSQLEKKYRKWIQEEVNYIITPNEKNVFLQLTSDRERDMFIEAFWKQRDPNPNTEENEFKTEHFRRIKYANETLGRGTPTPGWRTDMGRIYIILGEPKYIENYENSSEVYPCIVWFYQGMVQYGLPNAFNVVFFKKEGAGDFILYSPLINGPQSLLIHYSGDVNDYISAYNELKAVNTNLANVSLSLIDGEMPLSLKPTMASDILVSKKIPSVPVQKINDNYATKLLKYKEYIDVDYSVNYVGNTNSLRVFRDDSGTFFVHYLIEPQKISLEQYESNFFANLEINGSVEDASNKVIYQFKKEAPIKLDQSQFVKIKDSLFSFQDLFPLIEGKYTVNILLRNVVSKEFTSIEREVTIPSVEKAQISPLLLAHSATRKPQYKGTNKAFLVDDLQLLPSPRNDFVVTDTLYVYFQLYGLTPEQQKNGHITYTIYKDEKPYKTLTKNMKDYINKNDIVESFPLEGFPAAYYNVRVSVYGSESLFLFLSDESFYISPSRVLPRPWVVSISSSMESPDRLNNLGIQYSNLGDFDKALSYLAQAFYKKPMDARLALDYCRMLNKLKQYDKLITVSEPFMKTADKINFVALVAIAHQETGKYETAISLYKDYLNYHGANMSILNAIGTCYTKLNNAAEALIAWEKSLQLFPNQPKLKEAVDALKKNKPETNSSKGGE